MRLKILGYYLEKLKNNESFDFKDTYFLLELLDNIHYEKGQLNFIDYIDRLYLSELLKISRVIIVGLQNSNCNQEIVLLFCRKINSILALSLNEPEQDSFSLYDESWKKLFNSKYIPINTEENIYNIEKNIFKNISYYINFGDSCLVKKSTFGYDIISYYTLRLLNKEFISSSNTKKIDDFLDTQNTLNGD